MRAKDDSEPSVRLAAKQAMVKLRQEARLAEESLKTEPAEAQAAAATPVSASPPERAAAPPAVPPGAADAEPEPKPQPKPRHVDIRLDGSVSSTRWG